MFQYAQLNICSFKQGLNIIERECYEFLYIPYRLTIKKHSHAEYAHPAANL